MLLSCIICIQTMSTAVDIDNYIFLNENGIDSVRYIEWVYIIM